MKRESIVFVGLLAAAFAVMYLGIAVLKLSVPQFLGLAMLVVLAALFFPRLHEFREYERAVVFRFGRYRSTEGPGLIWLFPVVENFEKVDLRTQILDIPPQEVITKENIKLKIDAAAYVKVVDPKKVVIEVKDVRNAAAQLLHAEIRTVIGRMPMEEVLEKTEEINAHLYKSLAEVAKEWGVQIANVEITDIEIPKGLLEATQRKQEALEYKAKVETEARAKQVAIEILDKATKQIDDKTLTYLYLDALKKISDGRASKIIFPLELSRLAHLLEAQMGGNGGYKQIVEGLVEAYKEKQAETKPKKKK